MKMFTKIILMIAIISSTAFTQTVMKQKLNMSVDEATTKLTENLKSKNMTIFTVIDHKKNAKAANLTMPNSKLIIFGNPNAGTSLMNDNIAWSYELPLKIAIFEDKNGDVWAYTRMLATDVKTTKEKARIDGINKALKNFIIIK